MERDESRSCTQKVSWPWGPGGTSYALEWSKGSALHMRRAELGRLREKVQRSGAEPPEMAMTFTAFYTRHREAPPPLSWVPRQAPP